MIRTKDIEEFLDNNIHGRDFNYSMGEVKEYRAEIIKRLRAYDRIITCHEKSNAVDMGELKGILDIVARLKRYDGICHDLKQMIARMSEDTRNLSNRVDKGNLT